MDNKSKKTKNNIESFRTLIFEMTAFVADGIAVVTALLAANQTLKFTLIIICVLWSLITISYIVVITFNTGKASKKLDAKYRMEQAAFLKEWGKRNHSLFHNLRNYTCQIDTNAHMTLDDAKETCRSICSYIAEVYKEWFSKCLGEHDVSVCLKIIESDKIFEDDYMNWTMKTVARSTSTEQVRTNIDRESVRIDRNTDFQVILSKKYKDDALGMNDMRSIEGDFVSLYNMQYHNSREDFLSYYRSAIIAPIKIDGRYAAEFLKKQISGLEDKDLVLGFLCIDSMKVFTTDYEIEKFSGGLEMAKSIVDTLYLFFEKVLICSIRNDSMKKMNGTYDNN